jgi:L-threonylcarbamoyladenylate synthase
MPARILSPTSENIELVARALRGGEVAAMPTETVYGLAGSVFENRALGKIYEAKERPTFDPLIVHVARASEGLTPDLAWLERQGLVNPAAMTEKARREADALFRAFWPGPFTVVLPKLPRVPDLATAGLATVGVRMPRHPVAEALIRAAGVPLAAPSANRFGRISPTSAAAVAEELGTRIDFILDGGPCEVGLESTITGWSGERGWQLLRPGGIPREDVELVLGAPLSSGTELTGAPLAPGMLESHYAPGKALQLLDRPIGKLSDEELRGLPEARKPGLILLSGAPGPVRERLNRVLKRDADVRTLSESGDLNEAASNLFRTLRELDRSDCDSLMAEPCPIDRGIGFAIADRLRRASAPR